MKFWDIIEDCLIDEGVDAVNEDDAILWEAEMGSFSIKFKNVAVDGDKLAWYQEEEYGKCLVRIKRSNGIIISWNPIESNDQDLVFKLLYIKWFGNRLIIIFEENLRTKIIQLENLSIAVLYNGTSSQIAIKEERIYVKDYNGEEMVYEISLRKEITVVNYLSKTKLQERRPAIELSPCQWFFMKLDKSYNKKETKANTI